jgi:hypothetical protein
MPEGDLSNFLGQAEEVGCYEDGFSIYTFRGDIQVYITDGFVESVAVWIEKSRMRIIRKMATDAKKQPTRLW